MWLCCHKLSLHLRNVGELSPFFSSSNREVLQTAWKHRMDGGAMEGAPYMEGTVKRLRKYGFIFIPPHSFPCHARREREVSELCLHSKGTVTCPGGSASCGTARVGPAVVSFLCPPFHHLGNGAFLELVDILLQLCWGCTLESLALWGCKGSYLVPCLVLYEMRKWAGIKAI